jgi:hypothetical protein
MKKGYSHSEAGHLGALASKPVVEAARQARKAAYEANPKTCLHCEKSLSYEQRHNKFCSHACSAAHNNAGKCRNGTPVPKGVCRNCGKPLEHKDRDQVYCGRDCDLAHKKARVIQQIEAGLRNSPPLIRRYLIGARGYKCESCGLNEWLGQAIPLQVDHTDGDAGNNVLSNLKLLCPNCHALTPTFGSKNRGNGRAWRRRYRAEKKRTQGWYE